MGRNPVSVAAPQRLTPDEVSGSLTAATPRPPPEASEPPGVLVRCPGSEERA